jgi:hypothetical protein
MLSKFFCNRTLQFLSLTQRKKADLTCAPSTAKLPGNERNFDYIQCTVTNGKKKYIQQPESCADEPLCACSYCIYFFCILITVFAKMINVGPPLGLINVRKKDVHLTLDPA